MVFKKYIVLYERSAVKNSFSTYVQSKLDSCFCEAVQLCIDFEGRIQLDAGLDNELLVFVTYKLGSFKEEQRPDRNIQDTFWLTLGMMFGQETQEATLIQELIVKWIPALIFSTQLAVLHPLMFGEDRYGPPITLDSMYIPMKQSTFLRFHVERLGIYDSFYCQKCIFHLLFQDTFWLTLGMMFDQETQEATLI